MPQVTYTGAKARASTDDRLSVTDGDKRYLLIKDAPTDVPASLVKRLKSDEFSGDHNFDFGPAEKE